MNAKSVVVIVSVICCCILVSLERVAGLQCKPCYNLHTGQYNGPECPAIPPDSDQCEHAYRPCGCCPECAGKIGDTCHHQTPPCEAHLVCVSASGEEKHHIEWGDNTFIGKCQLPNL